MYSGLLDSEGEGEGGMIWENGIETCKNRITSLCPMQDTACLGLVNGDDPEGCFGEEGGRGVHVGIACTPVVDSCQCMSKPIKRRIFSLYIKKILFKKIKK